MVITSIITLPLLVKFVGAEGYGLIGFFYLLQSWLMLLDLGMSPTLSREIARYRGGALSSQDLLYLFNSMKKIFLALAILCMLSMFLFSNYIATTWLKLEILNISLVRQSICLMGAVIAIRWVAGIYKSAITGFEKLVWLSAFNISIATLRFIVVFPIFYYFSATPIVFFSYQLIVAIVEFAGVFFFVKKLMPKKSGEVRFDQTAIKKILKFTLTIAFTSSVWVVITQTDKLILSKLLTLSEFGYFSLAVQVAGGIILLTGPVSAAILPRLAWLEAENKSLELIKIYRDSTQFVVVTGGTASLLLIFFSKQVLLAWTGDLMMTTKVAPYVTLYAIGNFFLAIGAFPYYLQYAKGKLKLHLYGNLGFIIILIPSLLVVVHKYGGIGAGYVWIAINAIYLFTWIPFIHNSFDKNLNRKWYYEDIFKILIIPFLISVCGFYLIPANLNRLNTFLALCLIAVLIFSAFIISSNKSRNFIKGLIKS